MKYILTSKLLSILLSFLLSSWWAPAQEKIKVHYLGHASFIIEFNDSINVLADFGTSCCWGLNSPIYDINDFVPLIMTYSHYHDDHYDPSRIPEGVTYTLDSLDILDISELAISPVRTCETTPGIESNTSFIFNYKDFNICHLGDAQAEIMNINDSAQQSLILEKFPDQIDLLFMTIEGVQQFIPEAEKFIHLLQPGMIVPMHYWTPEYKEDFLDYLQLQNDTAGKNYIITEHSDAELELDLNDTVHNAIKVHGLCPMPYTGTTFIRGKNFNTGIMPPFTIYPNPAKYVLHIEFTEASADGINVMLISQNGRYINPLFVSLDNNTGCYELDIKSLHPGIYYIILSGENIAQVKKFIKI